MTGPTPGHDGAGVASTLFFSDIPLIKDQPHVHTHRLFPDHARGVARGLSQPQSLWGRDLAPSADLAAGQVVALFTVPKGFTVTDLNFDVTKLDGGATPALTFSIGDAANPGRFLAGSNAAQSAEAEADTMVAGCLGFKFTSDTDILFTAGTGAATPAAGTLTLFLKGFIDA